MSPDEEQSDAPPEAPEGPETVAPAPAAARRDVLAIVLVPRRGPKTDVAGALDVSCVVCAQPCMVDPETAASLPEHPHVHVCGQCGFTISELMVQLIEHVLMGHLLPELATALRSTDDGATLH